MRIGNEIGGVRHHNTSTDSKGEYRYRLLHQGQTMKDLPRQYWHDSFQRRAFRRVRDGTPTEKRGGAPAGIRRLRGDRQCLTITGAAPREFIHPHSHRPLTLRECSRLQTFPDSYQFVGSQASIARQIGNAVPPLAAFTLAHHLQSLDGAHGADCRSTIDPPRLFGFVLTDAVGMSKALRNTEELLSDIMHPQMKLPFT